MTDRVQGQKAPSITVVDVARLAGVSPMTVSRVMNKPENVAAETVDRVRAAASKLGYVRNRLAGGLRSSKSHLVAAIVPTLSGPVFMDSIEALTSGLTRRGYHLMVGQTGYTNPREDELLADIISRRPDAVVLAGAVHSREAQRRLISAGIPVLEFWDYTQNPIDMLVGFSHEAVGASVAQYLATKGRRRLAYIGADDGRSKRRAAAFEQRARELGLADAVSHLVPAPASLGDGRRALRALLAEKKRVDAVFCSSDMVANGVLIEARARGIDVPARLAVVGFGDLNFASDLDPALTSVHVDAARVGELASELIVKRLHDEPIASRVINVGFAIRERDSG
jgi:LacI family transcriptional regulator, gluconate utilization system Gnt-I transcriptional repressor